MTSYHIFLVEMDPKERLARQRKLLQKKLGLDMGAAIGMDTEELFNDEDLDYTCQTTGLKAHGNKVVAGSSSHNHVVGVILALCHILIAKNLYSFGFSKVLFVNCYHG